jgi:hypothetical protein
VKAEKLVPQTYPAPHAWLQLGAPESTPPLDDPDDEPEDEPLDEPEDEPLDEPEDEPLDELVGEPEDELLADPEEDPELPPLDPVAAASPPSPLPDPDELPDEPELLDPPPPASDPETTAVLSSPPVRPLVLTSAEQLAMHSEPRTIPIPRTWLWRGTSGRRDRGTITH